MSITFLRNCEVYSSRRFKNPGSNYTDTKITSAIRNAVDNNLKITHQFYDVK